MSDLRAPRVVPVADEEKQRLMAMVKPTTSPIIDLRAPRMRVRLHGGPGWANGSIWSLPETMRYFEIERFKGSPERALYERDDEIELPTGEVLFRFVRYL